MGIDSLYTGQPSKGVNCRDNPHLFFIFWRAWVCWPLFCFCRPFRIFERCLRIRAQIAAVESRRATNLATHLIRTQIQITQPGSSTVKLCTNRGGNYCYSFYFAILCIANTTHTIVEGGGGDIVRIFFSSPRHQASTHAHSRRKWAERGGSGEGGGKSYGRKAGSGPHCPPFALCPNQGR